MAPKVIPREETLGQERVCRDGLLPEKPLLVDPAPETFCRGFGVEQAQWAPGKEGHVPSVLLIDETKTPGSGHDGDITRRSASVAR
jgi:hypothetical protein